MGKKPNGLRKEDVGDKVESHMHSYFQERAKRLGVNVRKLPVDHPEEIFPQTTMGIAISSCRCRSRCECWWLRQSGQKLFIGALIQEHVQYVRELRVTMPLTSLSKETRPQTKHHPRKSWTKLLKHSTTIHVTLQQEWQLHEESQIL